MNFVPLHEEQSKRRPEWTVREKVVDDDKTAMDPIMP